MKSIAKIALEPGMKLAEDIADYKGKVLMSKGKVLDQKDIEKLSVHKNIMAVMILDEVDMATTHYEKVRLSDGFKRFEQIYNQTFPSFVQSIDAIVTGQTNINWANILGYYVQVTSAVRTGDQMLDYLNHISPSEDTLIYSHLFNSGIIAGVFAGWLGLSKEECFLLIQCGFFFDIGKFRLPSDLILKAGKLTDLDFAMIKTHTFLGYELLQKAGVDMRICNAALMHHERCDGLGYPTKLSAEQIDTFAKYIAIIDSYEAMSSPRVYRQSLNAFQIIENFEKDGFLRYDNVTLNRILSRIANTQMGLTAKLDDGTEGEIVLINPTKLSRPLLKLSDGKLLNLATDSTASIVQLY